MPTSLVMIENRTSKAMLFHIEPECVPFEIPPGKIAEITGSHATEPITVQYSDDENGLFGAVFPGDGEVIVRINGQDVREYS